MLFIGDVKMEKLWGGEDVLGNLSFWDMFNYPLAFHLGFKLPFHLIVKELLKRNVTSPYPMVQNT